MLLISSQPWILYSVTVVGMCLLLGYQRNSVWVVNGEGWGVGNVRKRGWLIGMDPSSLRGRI